MQFVLWPILWRRMTPLIGFIDVLSTQNLRANQLPHPRSNASFVGRELPRG
jgi:hypothetical protein